MQVLLKKKNKKSDNLILKIHALYFILMISGLLQELQLLFSPLLSDTIFSHLQPPGLLMAPE